MLSNDAFACLGRRFQPPQNTFSTRVCAAGLQLASQLARPQGMASSDEETPECQVCLEDLRLASGSIQQCPVGHLQCSACFARVGGEEAPCPVCQRAMGNIRAGYLEKMRDRYQARQSSQAASRACPPVSVQEQVLRLAQTQLAAVEESEAEAKQRARENEARLEREAERRRREAEAANRKQEAVEAAARRREEEATRKQEEERKEEEARKKKQEEAEAATRRGEEVAARKKQAAEEAAKRKQEAEEAAERRREEDAARKQEEAEAAKRGAEEARKKKQEAAIRQREETASRKKQEATEAAGRRRAAAKRKEEEAEAAASQRRQQAAAAKRREEEAAKRLQAAEDRQKAVRRWRKRARACKKMCPRIVFIFLVIVTLVWAAGILVLPEWTPEAPERASADSTEWEECELGTGWASLVETDLMQAGCESALGDLPRFSKVQQLAKLVAADPIAQAAAASGFDLNM